MERVSDEVGVGLHDRSTCGEVLTSEEEGLLEAWYIERDAMEAVWLNPGSVVLPDLAGLQARLDGVLDELRVSVEALQQVSFENQELRREIAGLYEQWLLPRSA